MKRIALFGKTLHTQDVALLHTLLQSVRSYDVQLQYYQLWDQSDEDLSFITAYESFSTPEELQQFNPDVMITLGGDGTILHGVRFIGELEIPILGINLGRLGFLASLETRHVEHAINALMTGNYQISSRSMLHLDLADDRFNGAPFALNDFTLHKRDSSSMVTIHTYINEEFLASYWADGIIVATPTGSTGYSLSCGGPIVFPNSKNFVLTPVAPHNLNVRPIVISDDSELRFHIEGRESQFLATLDSQSCTVQTQDVIRVYKSSIQAKLIQLEDVTFMKTLRNKLAWGKDVRN